MRILHFINNENLSWYQMFLDTIRAQERRGHWVKVVVPPGGVNYERLLGDNVRVRALPVRSSKFDIWSAWRLSRILRADKIDIIHTHLTSSALLGSIAARWAGGVPCVASVLKITNKRHYMRCDRLLPCSDAVCDDLLQQGVPAGMIRRVYTGIDFERFFAGFDPALNLREEFRWGEEHRIVISVARLVPMKGHRHLVDAAAEVVKTHPEARFLIIGDGELRSELERQTLALRIGQYFVFAGTRTELPALLNSADVSVLASVDKEGLPIALVESALMKKPLVMSDVAGIREMVKDGETGCLVPPCDPEALAEAIVRVLDEPERARKMAEAAEKLVRREFDVNSTTLQLEEEYEKLICKRNGGGCAATAGLQEKEPVTPPGNFTSIPSKYRDVEKILVISLTCIGDVLLTTPVVASLRDSFPGANITFLAGKTCRHLMEDHPLVDRLVIFDNRGVHKGWKGVMRLILELRHERYDMVVDLRNTPIPYFLRARHRLTALRTHMRHRDVRSRHAIDRHLDVISDHGVPATRAEMVLQAPDEVVARAGESLRARGVPQGATLIGVYPGAGSKYKEYPPEKFSEVLRGLASSGDRWFAVVGGGGDVEAAARVAGAVPERTVNLAGEIDLLEVAGLFKQCRLLISNDSGPMHVGIAVGTPTLALFGPTDSDRYGPRGEPHSIVSVRKECSPCKRPDCGMDSCIGEIEVEDIVETAEKMLGSS